jgi:hypothetical protein
VLEARIGNQKTASLATIAALADPIRYSALRLEVDRVINDAQSAR